METLRNPLEISVLCAGLAAVRGDTMPSLAVPPVLRGWCATCAMRWAWGVPVDGNLVATFGDVRIDTVAWRVHVREREVHLTRTEFLILVVLASRPGRVVPEAEIVREVWGPNWFGDDNNVKVHVSKLRAKLGESGSVSRYISTVRGVGYRFELPPVSGASPAWGSVAWALVGLGPDLLVRDVRPADAPVLGFSPGDLLGRYLPFSSELPWVERGSALAAVSVLMEAGVTSWSAQYTAPSSDGREVPVRVAARLLCGPQRELTGMGLELTALV